MIFKKASYDSFKINSSQTYSKVVKTHVGEYLNVCKKI